EVGNSLGEEVWLKSIAVNAGGGGALDLSAAESPLPRWRAHRAGDQRRPTVIAGGLPSRPEVLALFEDLGRSYHVRAEGLVAVEAIAAPMLRLGESSCDGQPDGASCTDGNRCNGSEACQNGQCVTVGPALVCNDNNRCTSDTCSSTLGCVYARADITCAAFDAPHRLAATISASSSAAGNPAVNAGDNDAATIWLASSTSSTSNNIAWIQLDFGAPKQLEQLRWTAGSGTPSLARSPANYVVETSLDATTWNLVVARTTAGVAQGLEFVGKIARYVRLSTTKVFDGLGSALSFFEIYGEGHDYQSGDLVKWQVFDDFNQPLSTDQWEIQRVGAGVASTASGKLTVDATAAASASMLLTTSSVRGRTVHVRNMHEAPGSGRCWYIGYLNSAVRKGVVLRRDLNPNYVPAAVQANMFFHVLSDAPQYVDLGPFGAGPGLDMTFGFYGNTIQVDVSKDGAFLSRQTTDASFLPSEVRFALVDYCGAKITVDDLLASP
ncbi:MAG TPA: discoidin domain-containing protein, partial [Polyangiaceae bacterium]|nr:discoidin domain-containing protein [Polyangiaceae bacterium]